MARSELQKYKESQVRRLPTDKGVYALCDLDEVPVYVGQSRDALRDRIRRHLTSARSDIIANRLIDVWEIAFVWVWPVNDDLQRKLLEHELFNEFNDASPLANGKVLTKPKSIHSGRPEKIRVQVMPDDVIRSRTDSSLRFPRQVHHFGELIDYIVNTQDKRHLRRALELYYNRLSRYYRSFVAPPSASKSKKKPTKRKST